MTDSDARLRESERRAAYAILTKRPIQLGIMSGRGFNRLGDLHNKWLLEFLWGTGNLTLQAHRGSYKTTVISLYLAIHTIIAPDETVIYFRKTDINVQEVMRSATKLLELPPMHQLCQMLYGHDYTITKQSATSVTTSLVTRATGAPQILGLGLGTSVTGKHADLVITDDIVTTEDRISPAARRATKYNFNEILNVLNRGGRLINTGTPWHKDDAFVEMAKTSGGIERYDCYHTGLITPKKLAEIKASMEPSLFAANYELRYQAEAERLFDNPGECDFIPGMFEGAKAQVDAAYGGADFTAFTVMRFDRASGHILAAGKLFTGSALDHLDAMVELMRRYGATRIIMETNGDKGFLAREFRRAGIPASGYPERMNKWEKITTYLYGNWDCIRWARSETDTAYLEQILDYNRQAAHDDAPDSAASLVRAVTSVAHVG